MRKSCEQCGIEVDLGTAHVRVVDGRIRVLCSPACAAEPARGAPVPPPAVERRPSPAARALRAVTLLLIASFAIANLSVWPDTDVPELAIAYEAEAEAPPADPSRVYGPSWPPDDDAWWTVLAQDAWVHPLPGPYRRMPGRASRVFGAERPGNRPGECGFGHCGVDLGHVWGDPVLAAHDGVVAAVQRNPDHPRGGLYVELSHRNDTVFTQYFHLAAIPRHLRPGEPVEAGQVIGLLGDTGVERSEPHLHFTIAVRSAPDQPKRYINPEPLVALWPFALPLPGGSFLVVSDGAPGVPVGPPRRPRRRREAPAPAPQATAAEEIAGPAEPAAPSY